MTSAAGSLLFVSSRLSANVEIEDRILSGKERGLE
jgi:hypothetical protein